MLGRRARFSYCIFLYEIFPSRVVLGDPLTFPSIPFVDVLPFVADCSSQACFSFFLPMWVFCLGPPVRSFLTGVGVSRRTFCDAVRPLLLYHDRDLVMEMLKAIVLRWGSGRVGLTSPSH